MYYGYDEFTVLIRNWEISADSGKQSDKNTGRSAEPLTLISWWAEPRRSVPSGETEFV